MSELTTRFEVAIRELKALPAKIGNASMLKAYALYKQATCGDVEGDRPGFSDMIGRAKWDAWDSIKGTATDDAMSQYVELVEALKDEVS